MGLIHLDFFINDKCNLKCKHCYVDPKKNIGTVETNSLISMLGEAIDLGVRTIGCTGKEPLLDFEKTTKIFEFLHEKKKSKRKILYGIVTNGTLLDNEKAKILNDLKLDYLDISIDGTEAVHDSIRGKGAYRKTMQNLENLLSSNLSHLNSRKIFIDFTLSQTNKNSLMQLTTELFKLGVKNMYISPYQAIKENDFLVLPPEEYADIVDIFMSNPEKYKHINFFFKNDIQTRKNIFELQSRGIIDLTKLYRDEAGVIYSIIPINNNRFYFNLLSKANNDILLRINSNGDITNCESMFKNKEYVRLGNIRENSISQILNQL